jgi:hypothetical protein
MLLLAALALRLIIAYVILPKSGFEGDLGTFTAWALRMVDVGPSGFYAEPGLSGLSAGLHVRPLCSASGLEVESTPPGQTMVPVQLQLVPAR